MAERDTFVTIADGDQLNDGYFNGIQPEIDTVNGSTNVASTNSGANTSSTTYTDVLDVTSAATNFDGQKVLIEGWMYGKESSSGSCNARVYDVTNTTALETMGLRDAGDTFYYMGKVAVTTAGNTLNVKIQVNGDGTQTGTVSKASLKLTLIPN